MRQAYSDESTQRRAEVRMVAAITRLLQLGGGHCVLTFPRPVCSILTRSPIRYRALRHEVPSFPASHALRRAVQRVASLRCVRHRCRPPGFHRRRAAGAPDGFHRRLCRDAAQWCSHSAHRRSRPTQPPGVYARQARGSSSFSTLRGTQSTKSSSHHGSRLTGYKARHREHPCTFWYLNLTRLPLRFSSWTTQILICLHTGLKT